MARKPPHGQRICQACDRRAIPTLELACTRCWRAMSIEERELLNLRYPRRRFIVPTVISKDSSAQSVTRFKSLVEMGWERGPMIEGPVRVELVVESSGERLVEPDSIISHVVGVLTGKAWVFSHQVKELSYFRVPERNGQAAYVSVLVASLMR